MLRALGVLALMTATAAAETSVELRIEERRIEASVVGIERQWQLELRDGERSVAPLIVRDFKQGKPLALAFVIEGTELALGTKELYGGTQQPGLFPNLRNAVDNLALRSVLPPDSRIAVVTYDEAASLRVAWKSVEEFAGDDLGFQKDYLGRKGNNLVAGVTLALDELAKRPEQRKLLIVIGGGTDTTGVHADATMGALKERATGVDIVALVTHHEGTPEKIAIDALTDRARETPDYQLSSELKEALDVATMRFEAVFDLAAFAHDGQEHTFRLMAGYDELGRARLKMPGTPPPSKTWRWLVVGGVIVAFSLMSLLLFRPRGRRV